ncbi:MAG: AsmA family protein [Geminicoccaceae bacterium]|nr:AsmA family protein [Geminicoccaceae bacterium]
MPNTPATRLAALGAIGIGVSLVQVLVSGWAPPVRAQEKEAIFGVAGAQPPEPAATQTDDTGEADRTGDPAGAEAEAEPVAGPFRADGSPDVGDPRADDTESEPASTLIPGIERFVVHGGEITYRDRERGADATATLENVEGEIASLEDLSIRAKGDVAGQSFDLEAGRAEPQEGVAEDGRSPFAFDLSIGGSRIEADLNDLALDDRLDASLTLDLESSLAAVLDAYGMQVGELDIEGRVRIEPVEGGSKVTVDALLYGDDVEGSGRFAHMTSPLQDFDAEVRAGGDSLGRLVHLAGLTPAPADLPAYDLSAAVRSDEGRLVVEQLAAHVGENELTGSLSTGDVGTLADLDAKLQLDAPRLGELLAPFDFDHAGRVSSARVDATIDRQENSTRFTLDGDVAGDTIDVEGRFDGPAVQPEDLYLDLKAQGSALSAILADLQILTRPVDRYAIEAMIDRAADDEAGVDLALKVEDTDFSFQGTVDELFAFRGVDGYVEASGPDPARVLELFELPSISLPPYEVSGQLVWQGDDIKVSELSGLVGDSDIKGTLAVDRRPKPVAVSGDLHSRLLDFDDLGTLIGAPAEADEGETATADQAEPSGGLLPDATIDDDLWQNLDLDVRYEADRIEAPTLPIDRIQFHVVSRGQVLSLEELRTGFADGAIEARAKLDGRQEPPAVDFEAEVDRMHLGDVLAKFGRKSEGWGRIDARIRLEGSGRSVDQVLANADGRIGVAMTEGGLSALILEAIGLDVAEGLAVLVDGSDQANEDLVPVRCAIANLEVANGMAELAPGLLDTPDSKIVVQGKVDLAAETLDLMITSDPKDFSILSANQTLHVDGPWTEPSVNPAPGGIESETLGWLAAPFAALFPFFDLGTAEDSPCGALIEQVKAGVRTDADEVSERPSEP